MLVLCLWSTRETIYRVIELVKKENVGTQMLILSGVHIRTT